MPAERTIACPDCKAERTTKGGSGAKVTCRGCGKVYRVPAAAAAAPSQVGTTTEDPRGVKVVRASSTKVRQTARPRAPKDSTAPAGATAPVDEAPVDETTSTKPPAVEPTRAQVLGRRGGRGYYAERVKGPRGRRG